MDTLLLKRDHARSPSGRPYLIGGERELLQRVLIRLTVPRGRFTPDPQLGSRLYRMPRGAPAQMESYARYAIEEALYGLGWVTLQSVSPALSPDGERVTLDCRFTIDGSAAALTLEL